MSNVSTSPHLHNSSGPAGSHLNAQEHDVYGDFSMDEELKRLAAINDELLGHPSSDAHIELNIPADVEEIARLRRENAQLRDRLDETESVLQAAAASEESWLERQKEYEALLEEKSEVIRGLHLKIHEMQDGKAAAAAPKAAAGPRVQDEQIDRLREELEEQRRQLAEDEKSLMQQMRQMELTMSRDRAEMARQRNDLQRLQTDLNREIELASRDPGLRDRLQSLQRRQQEPARASAKAPPVAPTPALAPPQQQVATTPAPKKQSSGLLRRLFGGSK